MALDKLKELGYKPRKKPAIEKEEIEVELETILKTIEDNETRRQILDLLVEALSESDPREILIYGMYVKKYLTPIVPVMHKEKIEKTLEWLSAAIEQIVKSGRK
jgi:ribosomal protein S7